MCSTAGVNTLLPAGLEIGLQRAGVAGEILARTELQGVHEDRHGDHGGAGRAAGVADQLAVALVQRAHRRDEQHAAPSGTQGPRHGGDGLR
jgi:hypothetical protein